MHIPRWLLVTLLLLLAAGADGAVRGARQEFTIENAGLSRTVSALSKFLITTKLEANGVQMLRQPGVEFTVELERAGEMVVLAPSDFRVDNMSNVKDNAELQTTVALTCTREGLPLRMSVNYFREPKAAYQQKSIVIEPCREAGDAILRRIVIDDLSLRPDFAPVSPVDNYADAAEGQQVARFRFDAPSNFAAMDPKSNKGLFFFVGSPSGTEVFNQRWGLVMAEEMRVPLSHGYATGRATISAVVGPPEVIYKRFRDVLWTSYCAARGNSKLPGPAPGDVPEAAADLRSSTSIAALVHRLNTVDRVDVGNAAADCLEGRRLRYTYGFIFPPRALDVRTCPRDLPADLQAAKYALLSSVLEPPQSLTPPQDSELSAYVSRFRAFCKKHEAYFEVYQHVLDFPDPKRVDGEGHMLNGKGFILLFNPSDQPRTVALPLDEPGLELRGQLKLSDWTDLDSSKPIGSARPGEKVEVELAPVSAKVIGVNMD